MLLAAPMGFAVWDWCQGAAVILDWKQVGVNFGALLTLSMLWSEIKRMNLAAAAQLEEQRKQIDA